MQTDLINNFIEAANSSSAIVTNLLAEKDKFEDVLLNILKDETEILLSIDNSLYENLFEGLSLKKKFILNPTNEQLTTLKTGITDAFCGIASTGSICISTKCSIANYISMLCRKHIVILKHENIISDLEELFINKLFGQDLLKSFSIITGTSATADMGPLVRGVHGPGVLHIIII